MLYGIAGGLRTFYSYQKKTVTIALWSNPMIPLLASKSLENIHAWVLWPCERFEYLDKHSVSLKLWTYL